MSIGEIQDVTVNIYDTVRIVSAMTWQTNAKAKMKLLKITYEDLAAHFGMTRGGIGHWLSGARQPTPDQFNRLATYIKSTPSELLGESEFSDSVMFSRSEPDNDNVARLPPHENGTLSKRRRLYVKGTAQLGRDGYWFDLEYPLTDGDGYVDVPSDDPQAYCIRVRGDSMFPAIRDNWIVAVEPNAPIVPGEYVHVKTTDGRYMVKELLWHRNGEYALHSVNQAHGRLTLREEDVEYAYFCWPVPPSKWRP